MESSGFDDVSEAISSPRIRTEITFYILENGDVISSAQNGDTKRLEARLSGAHDDDETTDKPQ